MKVGSLRLAGASVAILALAVALAPPSGAAGKPALTADELKRGKEIFFQRCAGCHGAFRKGGIGKALAPETMQAGTDYYKAFIAHGSEAGMPQFEDDLSKTDIDILARYVQSEEAKPPAWGNKETDSSWKVIVPVDKRPARKFGTLDLDNLFSVVLGDPGQVALIDGNAKRIVEVVDTGPGMVHATRTSASGRYLYALGRDGRVTQVDLWMDPPQPVAEVRVGLEARGLEVSRAKGFEDLYVVVGSTWPAQYVILDGKTLKPLVYKSTEAMIGKNKVAGRIAAIGSSAARPEFVATVKETGKVLLIDYSQISRVYHTALDGAPFLAEGGFDSSGRYFMVAANLANQILVVDTTGPKVVKTVMTGNKPNPSHGANFIDPQFGPVWATPHLGDSSVALIGTDPARHAGSAWKVVRTLKGPSAGASAIKAHPKSQNLWVDYSLRDPGEFDDKVAVWDIRALDKPPQTLAIAKLAKLAGGRVVDAEYSKAGDEIWFSVAASKSRPSAIVVVDDRTRKVKTVIRDQRLVTPAAQFNAYNTRHDVH
ncbi:MAG: c-type cytochrome [Candidatus Sericytochromatia bacterium]|nr:c-type cytochrome [Candidatus Tanganyikabacteria bacterium]